MGLTDRDYTRARDAVDTGAQPRSRGWSTGRIRSLSPRGGVTASIIIIALCTAVFVLDAALPPVMVQSGQWVVAPQLQQRVQALVQRVVEIDARLARARAANDSTAVAALEQQRAETESAVQQGIELVGNATTSWMTRLERGDYLVRNVPQGRNGVVREALDPDLPGADPLAVARFDRVGPIRGALQFTTAQALWVPAKWGASQGLEFWRFVGYGLLHVSLTHLLFNMLGLWIFGPIVEQAFGRLRFFAVFTLSVVIGALLYFLLNIAGLAVLGATDGEFAIPGLLFNNPYLPLIGASAGVYGIILAAAWLRPDEEILVLFILPVKLRHFALVLIAVAVLTLLQHGQNAGGEAAHLGGAIAGWWIARRPHLLDDFFPFFHRFDGRRAPRPKKRGASDAEIDRILDKVREKGLASLTERERASLRSATDEQRGRDG